MRITTIYGCHAEGYLRGDARRAAEAVVAAGGQVSAQGPERSNETNMITLLTRLGRRGGWNVWGRTNLYDTPE